MSAAAHSIYLESCLAPLGAYLSGEDVTDIYINKPGELWIERLGGDIEQIANPALTGTLLMRLARQVAAVSAQGINRSHPILSAVLPTGERVQIVIPPATRGEIAIAIRKHSMRGLGLDAYQASGATQGTAITSHQRIASRQPSVTIDADADPVPWLRDAVRARRNILVCGGTSSGKTTFLNALLAEVPLEERLVLIEDSPELQSPQPNHVGLLATRGALGEASVTAEDLLIASLRMRPDRIILGEIRGVEAATFLRAVNTGHPGSLTTIHADSPRRAIDQLALLVLQNGMQMSWDNVLAYVQRSLDLVVHLERGPSGRRIAEVMDMGR